MLSADELASRGIERLPQSLREAVDAFAADAVVQYAFGAGLSASVVAVRESRAGALRRRVRRDCRGRYALAALTGRTTYRRIVIRFTGLVASRVVAVPSTTARTLTLSRPGTRTTYASA